MLIFDNFPSKFNLLGARGLIAKFWKVGTGDAITIHFIDTNGRPRNLFIDSGFLGTFKATLLKELTRIRQANQQVDLWILTHTDRDHIGGAEAFVKDNTMADKAALVSEFWFNWSDYTFMPVTGKISVGQGIVLREYLTSIGKLKNADIVSGSDPINFFGCKFTIFSPSQLSLQKSKVQWKREEARQPVAAAVSDYRYTIEELSQMPGDEDTDPFNGGSIAFLLHFGKSSMLFLGDSHPSVIVDFLNNLGYSRSRRLVVDYTKLSHHGSKRNTNRELLELLDCQNFIILADGVSHALPNKWTLANILTARGRDLAKKVTFYFNSPSPALHSIFNVDVDRAKYNFDCVYSADPFLEIKLPPEP